MRRKIKHLHDIVRVTWLNKAYDMKNHFKLISAAIFLYALVLAEKGEIKLFFLALSFALELYSLTQIEFNNAPNINIKNLKIFISTRLQNSTTGKVCELAALVCLGGYFIYF
jgi:hypothetical protein